MKRYPVRSASRYRLSEALALRAQTHRPQIAALVYSALRPKTSVARQTVQLVLRHVFLVNLAACRTRLAVLERRLVKVGLRNVTRVARHVARILRRASLH